VLVPSWHPNSRHSERYPRQHALSKLLSGRNHLSCCSISACSSFRNLTYWCEFVSTGGPGLSVRCYQHRSFFQKLFFGSFPSFNDNGEPSFSLKRGRAAVPSGCVASTPPDAVNRRASTTRRTSTALSVCRLSRFQQHSRAKVSSMLTISLALVSMKPQRLFRAHSSPSAALMTRPDDRSHLLPATSFTGGTLPWSILFSSSMSIISVKYSRPSRLCWFVIS
jgi:hypothetical protein